MLINGDCLVEMAKLEPNSIDTIVTDPPYGLEFMGKEWDRLTTNWASVKEGNNSPHARRYSINYIGNPNPTCRICGGLWSLNSEGSGGRRKCHCEKPDFPDYRLPAMLSIQEWHYRWAAAALRIAKPGCHLLAFGGTRTFHRLTCALEDAGWEIRDCLMWVYGSGFPKSHNLKGEWQGWGTALKPAWEPIIMARKPLDGTVAENVQKWGTGAINVNGCRVDTFKNGEMERLRSRADSPRQDFTGGRLYSGAEYTPKIIKSGMTSRGRWPANLIHDGSEKVIGLFPVNGRSTKPSATGGHFKASGLFPINNDPIQHNDNGGSAARFFYCAKASRTEREVGLGGMEEHDVPYAEYRKAMKDTDSYVSKYPDGTTRPMNKTKNFHPTVKPLALMRYLCRLVTPPNGLILDPFMGSGTTGMACKLEGCDFVGIEIDKDYFDIAEKRIDTIIYQPEIMELRR